MGKYTQMSKLCTGEDFLSVSDCDENCKENVDIREYKASPTPSATLCKSLNHQQGQPIFLTPLSHKIERTAIS